LYVLTNKYSVNPEFVELELTESMMFDDVDHIQDIVAQLHEIGYKISMDDFGSGYSSLSLLKDMDLDVLKIDRSLLGDKLTRNTRLLLDTVVRLAKSLSMHTICEGVEYEEQATFLKSVGCDAVQGYLFAKPMPVDEFNNKYYG
jgi:EAL domain-containing protein (putative c-di-GMP-specific phosphodiesterase class I)